MDEYISSQPDSDSVALAAPTELRPGREPARRTVLPITLFALTCVSTCFTGGVWSEPKGRFDWELHVSWSDGLTYMAAVMAILVAHEMGHFLQAVRYRVPASWPFFIPMPFSPIGTMGAIIGMGTQANRRQLFDIGISGPLAGLVVAIPVACYGVMTAEVYRGPAYGQLLASDPLLFQWLIRWLRPELSGNPHFVWNPYYMAAWVGMLITGLNMLPISQLDGGHVAYALFGRRAHQVARFTVAGVFAFAVVEGRYGWLLMLGLVTFLGIYHPPTSDDSVELGFWRKLLGGASLVIPLLCLSPSPLDTLLP